MLKKIHAGQLRLGMYIKEFCGSWMEHPFWLTTFLLDRPKDLRAILACSITEVWIDTSRGLDVELEQPAQSEEEVQQRADETLLQVAAEPAPVEHLSMAEEMERAAAICAKSKDEVIAMFQEARLGKAVNTANALEMVEEISGSVARNPGALISLARIKKADEYTYLHSVAVCALMIAMGRQLGLDEQQIREAGVAGLLHDLGKARIPQAILNKPGRLTEREFAIIKTHPAEGHRMLIESGGVNEVVLDVCLHHHEKMDGTGYPVGLPADEISVFVKMIALCDVYDAITSNRPYKPGWNPAESLHKMAQWAQGHFDTAFLHAFVKSVGIYPVGSCVRLESGRLGVVTEQGGTSLLTPKVKVFFSVRSRTHIRPEVLDLAEPSVDDRIITREEPADWGIGNLDQLWSEGLAA